MGEIPGHFLRTLASWPRPALKVLAGVKGDPQPLRGQGWLFHSTWHWRGHAGAPRAETEQLGDRIRDACAVIVMDCSL